MLTRPRPVWVWEIERWINRQTDGRDADLDSNNQGTNGRMHFYLTYLSCESPSMYILLLRFLFVDQTDLQRGDGEMLLSAVFRSAVSEP